MYEYGKFRAVDSRLYNPVANADILPMNALNEELVYI